MATTKVKGRQTGDISVILFNLAPRTWDDMPAATTEIFGDNTLRTKVDLTDMSRVRLLAGVIKSGATGAVIRGQYSTDGTSWYNLDGSNGPVVSIDTTGVHLGNWVLLCQGAKGERFIRLVGANGDGATDVVFGRMELQID